MSKKYKDEEEGLGKLEESVRAQTSRKRIETAILGSVAITGMLSVAVIAPNAIQVLHKALPDMRPVNQKQSIRRAINRLIRNGYLKKVGNKYKLTNSGEKRIEKLLIHFHRTNTLKKHWDKKWRVVIYDIPEKEKIKRNELRNMLIQTGFVKLQESVWVFPFRCDEIVSLLKFRLKLGRKAVYMIVDAIENDEWLRKHFNLPKAR